MRVRADFVALDRATRDMGGSSDEALAKLHDDARGVHDRWAAVFRAERAATPSPGGAPVSEN